MSKVTHRLRMKFCRGLAKEAIQLIVAGKAGTRDFDDCFEQGGCSEEVTREMGREIGEFWNNPTTFLLVAEQESKAQPEWRKLFWQGFEEFGHKGAKTRAEAERYGRLLEAAVSFWDSKQDECMSNRYRLAAEAAKEQAARLK